MKTIQYFSDQALEYGRNASPEEIVEFLENFRELQHERMNPDGKRASKMKLISIKMPEELLTVFRIEAAKRNIPYQTLIKKLMQEWLLNNPS